MTTMLIITVKFIKYHTEEDEDDTNHFNHYLDKNLKKLAEKNNN